ncbi:MAG TPA: hypothetical protein VKA46_34215 [Gemmataceae bacterium]|nr:hypothetical protein [Gemmataceae bacterium]
MRFSNWEDPGHLRRLARTCETAGYNNEARRWRERADQLERANSAALPPLP